MEDTRAIVGILRLQTAPVLTLLPNLELTAMLILSGTMMRTAPPTQFRIKEFHSDASVLLEEGGKTRLCIIHVIKRLDDKIIILYNSGFQKTDFT